MGEGVSSTKCHVPAPARGLAAPRHADDTLRYRVVVVQVRRAFLLELLEEFLGLRCTELAKRPSRPLPCKWRSEKCKQCNATMTSMPLSGMFTFATFFCYSRSFEFSCYHAENKTKQKQLLLARNQVGTHPRPWASYGLACSRCTACLGRQYAMGKLWCAARLHFFLEEAVPCARAVARQRGRESHPGDDSHPVAHDARLANLMALSKHRPPPARGYPQSRARRSAIALRAK